MDDSLVDRSGSPSPPKVTPAMTAKTVFRFALLGFASLPVLVAYQLVLYVGAVSVFGPIPTTGPRAQIISVLSLGLGTLTLAVAYLKYSDREWSFVDLRFPTLRDVGWALGGFVILLLGFVAITSLINALGLSTAQHSTAQQAQQGDPALLLPLIPLSLLVIGPGEELLYRNVIQKSLYDHFSRVGAVVVASAIFALVHIPAYATGGGVGAMATSLAVIFVLALVLGGVYARTDNVLVPAFIHGAYNALSFAATYVDLTNTPVENAIVTLATLV
ncbi:CPBP family intramembrane glutamic endopeptidase [Haloarchaeobius amylolyticus]|uniref:CPBP family intramembrane glutamic endopeptidase n=1 Tax=Haloarchaeobius amylolyticus TaxID=1198296 RepID=UPI0022705544|nr:type II CAAX endopeptidase family protein [Haloarchaeobius amylolyticus]